MLKDGAHRGREFGFCSSLMQALPKEQHWEQFFHLLGALWFSAAGWPDTTALPADAAGEGKMHTLMAATDIFGW